MCGGGPGLPTHNPCMPTQGACWEGFRQHNPTTESTVPVEPQGPRNQMGKGRVALVTVWPGQGGHLGQHPKLK